MCMYKVRRKEMRLLLLLPLLQCSRARAVLFLFFFFFYYFVAASISRGGWGTLMQEPQRRSVEGEVCVTVPRLACLTVCLSFYVDPSNSNVIIHTCLSVYLFFP